MYAISTCGLRFQSVLFVSWFSTSVNPRAWLSMIKKLFLCTTDNPNYNWLLKNWRAFKHFGVTFQSSTSWVFFNNVVRKVINFKQRSVWLWMKQAYFHGHCYKLKLLLSNSLVSNNEVLGLEMIINVKQWRIWFDHSITFYEKVMLWSNPIFKNHLTKVQKLIPAYHTYKNMSHLIIDYQHP